MRTKGAALGTSTNWICNFIVVEITPIGIQSLHWQFYIIWVVFNFSFVPLVYFFYPETADRTLEDLDAYYRDNPPLLVWKDKDVKSSKRPQKYIEAEHDAVHRASSVDAATFRRESKIGMPGRGMSLSSTLADGRRGTYAYNEKQDETSGQGVHVDDSKV